MVKYMLAPPEGLALPGKSWIRHCDGQFFQPNTQYNSEDISNVNLIITKQMWQNLPFGFGRWPRTLYNVSATIFPQTTFFKIKTSTPISSCFCSARVLLPPAESINVQVMIGNKYITNWNKHRDMELNCLNSVKFTATMDCVKFTATMDCVKFTATMDCVKFTAIMDYVKFTATMDCQSKWLTSHKTLWRYFGFKLQHSSMQTFRETDLNVLVFDVNIIDSFCTRSNLITPEIICQQESLSARGRIDPSYVFRFLQHTSGDATDIHRFPNRNEQKWHKSYGDCLFPVGKSVNIRGIPRYCKK